MTTTPTTPTPPPQPHVLSVDELPSIFSDLVPIEQPPSNVCQIQYKADFAIAYNYFRALLQQRPDEASDRALRLTELCASMNPSNYSVWQHRRTIYRKLWQVGDKEVAVGAVGEAKEKDGLNVVRSRRVRYELDLAARLGGSNPKTYQVWYHRRAVVEHLRDVVAISAAAAVATSKETSDSLSGNDDVGRRLVDVIDSELEYVNSVVKVDGKNYHAWSYRQFLVMTMLRLLGDDDDINDDDSDNGPSASLLLSEELAYTANLLHDDLRNNSAWNHRWFVVIHQIKMRMEKKEQTGTTDNSVEDVVAPLVEELWRRETAYALELAMLDPYNESPWRYLVAGVRDHVRRQRPENDDEGTHTQWVRETLAMYERKAWDVMPGAEATVSAFRAAETTGTAADEGVEGPGASDSADIDIDGDAVSPHLLAAVVDLLELALEVVDGGNNDVSDESTKASPRARAAHLCRCLEMIDPIRQKYWRRRGAQDRFTAATT